MESGILAILRKANSQLKELQELHKAHANGQLEPSYEIRDGILCFQGKILVPNEPSLKLQLLQEFHSSPPVGHRGILKTYQLLRQFFHWPKLKQEVHEFVSAFEVCQSTKYSTSKP